MSFQSSNNAYLTYNTNPFNVISSTTSNKIPERELTSFKNYYKKRKHIISPYNNKFVSFVGLLGTPTESDDHINRGKELVPIVPQECLCYLDNDNDEQTNIQLRRCECTLCICNTDCNPNLRRSSHVETELNYIPLKKATELELECCTPTKELRNDYQSDLQVWDVLETSINTERKISTSTETSQNEEIESISSSHENEKAFKQASISVEKNSNGKIKCKYIINGKHCYRASKYGKTWKIQIYSRKSKTNLNQGNEEVSKDNDAEEKTNEENAQYETNKNSFDSPAVEEGLVKKVGRQLEKQISSSAKISSAENIPLQKSNNKYITFTFPVTITSPEKSNKKNEQFVQTNSQTSCVSKQQLPKNTIIKNPNDLKKYASGQLTSGVVPNELRAYIYNNTKTTNKNKKLLLNNTPQKENEAFISPFDMRKRTSVKKAQKLAVYAYSNTESESNVLNKIHETNTNGTTAAIKELQQNVEKLPNQLIAKPEKDSVNNIKDKSSRTSEIPEKVETDDSSSKKDVLSLKSDKTGEFKSDLSLSKSDQKGTSSYASEKVEPDVTSIKTESKKNGFSQTSGLNVERQSNKSLKNGTSEPVSQEIQPSKEEIKSKTSTEKEPQNLNAPSEQKTCPENCSNEAVIKLLQNKIEKLEKDCHMSCYNNSVIKILQNKIEKLQEALPNYPIGSEKEIKDIIKDASSHASEKVEPDVTSIKTKSKKDGFSQTSGLNVERQSNKSLKNDTSEPVSQEIQPRKEEIRSKTSTEKESQISIKSLKNDTSEPEPETQLSKEEIKSNTSTKNKPQNLNAPSEQNTCPESCSNKAVIKLLQNKIEEIEKSCHMSCYNNSVIKILQNKIEKLQEALPNYPIGSEKEIKDIIKDASSHSAQEVQPIKVPSKQESKQKSVYSASDVPQPSSSIPKTCPSMCQDEAFIKIIHDRIKKYIKTCPSSCYNNSLIKVLQNKIEELEKAIPNYNNNSKKKISENSLGISGLFEQQSKQIFLSHVPDTHSQIHRRVTLLAQTDKKDALSHTTDIFGRSLSKKNETRKPTPYLYYQFEPSITLIQTEKEYTSETLELPPETNKKNCCTDPTFTEEEIQSCMAVCETKEISEEEKKSCCSKKCPSEQGQKTCCNNESTIKALQDRIKQYEDTCPVKCYNGSVIKLLQKQIASLEKAFPYAVKSSVEIENYTAALSISSQPSEKSVSVPKSASRTSNKSGSKKGSSLNTLYDEFKPVTTSSTIDIISVTQFEKEPDPKLSTVSVKSCEKKSNVSVCKMKTLEAIPENTTPKIKNKNLSAYKRKCNCCSCSNALLDKKNIEALIKDPRNSNKETKSAEAVPKSSISTIKTDVSGIPVHQSPKQNAVPIIESSLLEITKYESAYDDLPQEEEIEETTSVQKDKSVSSFEKQSSSDAPQQKPLTENRSSVGKYTDELPSNEVATPEEKDKKSTACQCCSCNKPDLNKNMLTNTSEVQTDMPVEEVYRQPFSNKSSRNSSVSYEGEKPSKMNDKSRDSGKDDALSKTSEVETNASAEVYRQLSSNKSSNSTNTVSSVGEGKIKKSKSASTETHKNVGNQVEESDKKLSSRKNSLCSTSSRSSGNSKREDVLNYTSEVQGAKPMEEVNSVDENASREISKSASSTGSQIDASDKNIPSRKNSPRSTSSRNSGSSKREDVLSYTPEVQGAKSMEEVSSVNENTFREKSKSASLTGSQIDASDKNMSRKNSSRSTSSKNSGSSKREDVLGYTSEDQGAKPMEEVSSVDENTFRERSKSGSLTENQIDASGPQEEKPVEKVYQQSSSSKKSVLSSSDTRTSKKKNAPGFLSDITEAKSFEDKQDDRSKQLPQVKEENFENKMEKNAPKGSETYSNTPKQPSKIPVPKRGDQQANVNFKKEPTAAPYKIICDDSTCKQKSAECGVTICRKRHQSKIPSVFNKKNEGFRNKLNPNSPKTIFSSTKTCPSDCHSAEAIKKLQNKMDAIEKKLPYEADKITSVQDELNKKSVPDLTEAVKSLHAKVDALENNYNLKTTKPHHKTEKFKKVYQPKCCDALGRLHHNLENRKSKSVCPCKSTILKDYPANIPGTQNKSGGVYKVEVNTSEKPFEHVYQLMEKQSKQNQVHSSKSKKLILFFKNKFKHSETARKKSSVYCQTSSTFLFKMERSDSDFPISYGNDGNLEINQQQFIEELEMQRNELKELKSLLQGHLNQIENYEKYKNVSDNATIVQHAVVYENYATKSYENNFESPNNVLLNMETYNHKFEKSTSKLRSVKSHKDNNKFSQTNLGSYKVFASYSSKEFCPQKTKSQSCPDCNVKKKCSVKEYSKSEIINNSQEEKNMPKPRRRKKLWVLMLCKLCICQ